jgi:predicted nucleic acid-binding protein
VLRLARNEGLIATDDALVSRLTDAGFHSSPELLAQLQGE